MTNSDDQAIIDAILKREELFSDDPDDKGGKTFKGISQKSNPDLWLHGPPTDAQVRQRYLTRYLEGPGFDRIRDFALRAQLVDFGVNSGPAVAIKKLQTVLRDREGFTELAVDGILGRNTLTCLDVVLASDGGRRLSNLLMAERIKMFGRIVQRDPKQLKWLGGWLNRGLEFLIP